MSTSAVKVNSGKSSRSAGKDAKNDVRGSVSRRETGPLTELAQMMAQDGMGPSMEGLAGEVASMPLARRQSTVLTLQRTRGNSFVQRLAIQAKLTVGPAGDKYEQEADHVADQVMRMTETPNPVQRQEDEEEIQTKPLAASITPLVQRFTSFITSPLQRQGEEEEIQTKPLVQRQGDVEEIPPKSALSGGSFDVGSSFESRLSSTRGSGSPLPDAIRRQMERGFGADFRGVRVHKGSAAAQLNRAVSAQAFTHGHDIYLGEGRYDPSSGASKRLLAHELTHVVQQEGSMLPESKAHVSGQVQSDHAIPAMASKRKWAAQNINPIQRESTRIQRGLFSWYKKRKERKEKEKKEAERKIEEEQYRKSKKSDMWTDWMIDINIHIRKMNLEGSLKMDALWERYLETLQRVGFRYETMGGDMWTESPNGSCMQLSNTLAMLAKDLGLDAKSVCVHQSSFVTPNGTKLVDGSAAKSNIKMNGQYVKGKYVFSQHQCVLYGGVYYDSLCMSMYSSPDHPVAWELNERGDDELQIVSVKDGATWPDSDEAITSENAYLVRTGDKPGDGFVSCWALSRKH
ncbi:MAG: hypothetical protein A4E48_01412 [Methanosaeta sp. PtaU1.Bin060]|nr:MAG: hypothetical protein A4E48_01412 [Methanosaeta sp. PtaU1.Bin060]